MRKILVIILVMLGFSSYAQTPSWQWINNGGSNGAVTSNDLSQRTKQIATDARGNIYGISSTSSYGITMDTLTPVNGFGYDDFVVFSYTCDGQFRWLKQFGSYNYDIPGGIIVSPNGEVFVSGIVVVNQWGDAHFGDSIIPATNNLKKTYFLSKLDSSGNTIWLKFPGAVMNNDWAEPIQMEADNKGNPVVLTWFSDSTTWNGHHISSMGHYLVKFNKSDGSIFEIVELEYKYNNNATGYSWTYFSLDDSNNVYLETTVGDTIFVGNTDTVYRDSENHQSFLLMKFNPQGIIVWNTEVEGISGTATEKSITGKPVIIEDKIYMLGEMRSFLGSDFYGVPIDNPYAATQYKKTRIFTSFNRYNGNFINAINLKNKEHSGPSVIGTFNGKLISVCSGGRLVVMNQSDTIKPYTNGYENYPFVVEIDTGLTHFNWGVATKTLQPNVSARMTNMHIDHNGNILLAGGINGAITNSAGDTTNMVASAENFFIAKVALTNDSCNCTASIPSIAVVGSNNNALTVIGSATNNPDSLYIIWGDGDSSFYVGSNANISHTYANSGPWSVGLRSYGFCGVEESWMSNLYSGIFPTDEKTSLTMAAYPNPFSSTLSIELSKQVNNVELYIYNLLGKQVYYTKMSGKQISINTLELSKGFYFIKLITEDGNTIVTKVVRD